MFKYLKGLLVAALLVTPSLASAQEYVKLWPNGASGNITVNGQAVTVANAREMGTIGIQIAGTWTGTVVPQCSIDGTNWVAIRVTPTDDTVTVESMTGNGIWSGSIAGCKQVRLAATASITGTANISINTIQGGGGGGANVSVGDITGDVTVGAQPVDDPHYVRCSNGSIASPCLVTGSGTAGTAAAGVVSIQGIALMTPILATVSDGAGALNTIVDSGTITTVSTVTNVGTLATITNPISCSNCSGGTQYTQDAALTIGSTVGIMAMGRASAAVPSDVSADSDAVLPWFLRSGAAAINPTFGGVLASAGNGASGTGVQRVTLASDSTGVLAGVTSLAQFAGNAINLGAGAVGTGTLRTTQASDSPVVTSLQLIDDTVFAEDGAHSNADKGLFILTKRTDSAASSATTDGDYATLNTDANGRLHVLDGNGAAALTALQLIDNPVGSLAGGAAGTSSYAVGAIYNSTPPTLTNGQQASLQLSSSGALIVTGSAGTTQYAEDAAHQTGDQVVFLGAVRRDTTPASSSNSAGDYSAINVDANGRVYVQAVLYNSSGSELTLASDKAEDSAHSDGDSGPISLTRRIDAAASSAGSSGDYATLNTDVLGLLWTRALDPCSGVAKTYIPINISTATTTELTAALAGASTNYYVCSINLVAAAAQTIALAYDDSDGCGSVTAGMAGGTTAATGWSFAANGGIVLGNGSSTVLKTGATNTVICAVTGQAAQISGTISVVAAP